MIRLTRAIFSSPVNRKADPLTWSPTDHNLSITVSDGGSTATRSSTLGGAWNSARSDTSQTSGVRYVEFSILQVGSTGMFVGVCNGVASFSSFVGSDNNGASYQSTGNTLKNNAFTGIVPGSFTTNDTVGMVVDLDGHTVKFNKNGGAFSGTIDITSLGSDVFVSCTLGDGSTFSSVKVLSR